MGWEYQLKNDFDNNNNKIFGLIISLVLVLMSPLYVWQYIHIHDTYNHPASHSFGISATKHMNKFVLVCVYVSMHTLFLVLSLPLSLGSLSFFSIYSNISFVRAYTVTRANISLFRSAKASLSCKKFEPFHRRQWTLCVFVQFCYYQPVWGLMVEGEGRE